MSSRRADPRDEVVPREEARAPGPLELGAEHPQAKHVDQQVADAAVQEHVGHELVDRQLLDDRRGTSANSTTITGTTSDTRKATTFVMIRSLMAGESAPGPNV